MSKLKPPKKARPGETIEMPLFPDPATRSAAEAKIAHLTPEARAAVVAILLETRLVDIVGRQHSQLSAADRRKQERLLRGLVGYVDRWLRSPVLCVGR